MQLFNNIVKPVNNEKPSDGNEPWELKFGITDINLNKDETDLLNVVSRFIVLQLTIYKESINNNAHIRLFSFFYILGIIDAYSQRLNAPNSSFFKVCIHLFFFDLRELGIKYFEFAKDFLENYNEVIKYSLVIHIMVIAGEDVTEDFKRYSETGISIPYSRLDSLINDWRKIAPNKYSAEQLEFLSYCDKIFKE